MVACLPMCTYTIAVCNYNMAETLEESLRSVLNQITDEFEVLVVDGGSTDGSVEILATLEAEYQSLRYIELEPNPKRRLGGDREVSVRKANGEYLLLHIDADDHYDDAILDFVTLYHQIEKQVGEDVLLVGSHITMARKETLLRLGSYRNLGAAEDIDLWRRAIISKDVIFLTLDSGSFWRELGYKKGIRERIRRSLAMKTAEFRIGVTFSSYVRWDVNQGNGPRIVYSIIISVLAYALSIFRGRYDGTGELTHKKHLSAAIANTKSLEQLCSEYDLYIDLTELSSEGRQYFEDSI